MTISSEKIYKITMPTPFAVGDVNVYLIKGDVLTLVDAGVNTKAAWETFQFQLAQYGFIPEDIEQVVLTHHHPDHVGLLNYLTEDIPVYGHQYVRPYLEKDETFFAGYNQFYKNLFVEFGLEGDFDKMLNLLKGPLKYASFRSLTYEIAEGDTVPGFENWSVFYTPGHAQSHLSFYREKDGVLIAGDHLLATISSNPLLEPALNPKDDRPRPQLQYNDSLRKLLDYDINIAYTGHGVDIKKVHDLVKRRIQRQHERSLQVKELLKGKQLTTFDITKQLFPAVYQKELALTLSETTAQLDYLLSIGLIDKEITDEGIAIFYELGERSYDK